MLTAELLKDEESKWLTEADVKAPIARLPSTKGSNSCEAIY